MTVDMSILRPGMKCRTQLYRADGRWRVGEYMGNDILGILRYPEEHEPVVTDEEALAHGEPTPFDGSRVRLEMPRGGHQTVTLKRMEFPLVLQIDCDKGSLTVRIEG